MPGGINIIDLPDHERKRIRSLSKQELINECEKLHKRILHIKTRIGGVAATGLTRAGHVSHYRNQLKLKKRIFDDCIMALETITNTMHVDFDTEINTVKMLETIISSLDSSFNELKAQVKALRAIQSEA